MENENNPTNNFELDITLIGNFFKGLDRQGPGGDEQTERAIAFVRDYIDDNRTIRVADLGCGTGRQTLMLANALNCHITAVDLLPQMIEGLEERIATEKLAKKVTVIQGSMDALDFDNESLDLIWAEGSIYNIGFERGLKEWNRFLRHGGMVAVTECCWLGSQRPPQTKWFTDNFMEIDSVATKIAQMERAGYSPTACFALPPHCWTDNYYRHMAERIEQFEAEYPNNLSALTLTRMLRTEMEMYTLWGNMYGYIFFVGRKE